MAGFDGSGTFNRQYSWVDDFNAGLFIDATRMDAEFDLIATALSNCVTRDGQSPATANIPMGSNKITGLAAGSAAADALRFDQFRSGASWDAEATVASATTCNILGAASNFILISGTTTITSFGTGTNKIRFVRFGGALTLTHDATSLILPGGANITTAAGDTCIVISDGSSNARVVNYMRASGGVLGTGTLSPQANDGAALGTSSLGWSDLFLATGGVINFGAGNVLITHSANALAFSGVTGGYTFDDDITVTGNVDATALLQGGTALGDTYLEVASNLGDVASASSARGNLGFTTANSFKAYPASNVATDHTNYAKVTFSTEAWDTGSKYASGRWTPAAGKVMVGFYLNSTGPGSTIIAAIYKNGSIFAASQQSTAKDKQLVTFDNANGTDYYEVYVQGGDASDVLVGGVDNCAFFGHHLPTYV